MDKWTPKKLPLKEDIESKKVLKRLSKAHAALAELKGIAQSIPNQNILINTLAIQEAKDSSEIENIITTHDELYKSDLNLVNSIASKEVQNYIEALKHGFSLIKKNNLITNNIIIEIQGKIEKNNAGFRKVPGTALKNAVTGETIYTPPQDHQEILDLMDNLEQFINDNAISDLDPIVKMAVIHFQFESIHPFYDGNGRTGRIINILYLIKEGLLELPILYLSNYIIKHKEQYYFHLQNVRINNTWEDWLIYIIDAVETISRNTINLIRNIKRLHEETEELLKASYKFYNYDLLNNLFKHPYTKIELVVNDLKVSRLTAANYLNRLSDDGILIKEKLGKSNYYINHQLFELLKKG